MKRCGWCGSGQHPDSLCTRKWMYLHPSEVKTVKRAKKVSR